jgi:hypothetical protein
LGSGLRRSTFQGLVDLVRNVRHYAAVLILYSVFTK